MFRPKISVIMSVYNESISQLNGSIDSIVNQSFRDFEFIILLDKPDNLKAKKYILKRKKDDTRIVFIENEKNLQSGPSLNKGIKFSSGKYLALMDGDDVCNKERLRKQYEFLKNNLEIDIVFTGWSEIDEKGNTVARIPTKDDFKNIDKTFFYKSPLLHASLMCRREVFENNTYSNISIPSDFALFLQLIKQGYNFGIVEENLYSYFINKYNINEKYRKIRIFNTNYLKILSGNIGHYWTNIYFWWMFLLVLVQWLLSRNKFIFKLFFIRLQKIYQSVFTK